MRLLGEHLEALRGPVLAFALREGIACAYGPRPDRSVRVLALDAGAEDRFALGRYVRSGRRFADLVRGACAVLEEEGVRLPGVDVAVAGDLPARRGLGASGAYLAVVLRALLETAERDAPAAFVARVAGRAEAEWADAPRGAPSAAGEVDAYVGAAGTRGRAMRLDTATLAHEDLPWPDGVDAVPLDSGLVRSASATPHAERRAQLERGVRAALRARGDAVAWTDLRPEDVAALAASVPDAERRRARHVVSELARVHEGVEALRTGDAVGLGRLLDASHESLARDYEGSTPAIDALVTATRSEPDVLGVRLQGAGWGGSLVVLRRTPTPPARESPSEAAG